MQSKVRSQESLKAYKQAKTIDVKAALLPGFARRRDYVAMPLIIQAITSDNVVLSGRAVATAQHLLGVRYETSVSQLHDPNFRKEIADIGDARLAKPAAISKVQRKYRFMNSRLREFGG